MAEKNLVLKLFGWYISVILGSNKSNDILFPKIDAVTDLSAIADNFRRFHAIFGDFMPFSAIFDRYPYKTLDISVYQK